MESTAVSYHWKTSMNVGALVTLVAAVHYFYMRESGTMYGIMGPGIGCFIAFILGLSGWFYILAEIFSGEAGQVAASGNVNKHVAASFKTMRFIVTVGWSIYPLGYFP